MELDEAVLMLRHSPAMECIVEHFALRREDCVRELLECPYDQVDRKIGQIAAYQDLLDVLNN